MNRTTIVLPDDMKDEAIRQARARGISFGELIREALERALRKPMEDASQRARRGAIEAMLQFGRNAVPGPPDLSDRLDDYLYPGPAAGKDS